MTLLAMFLALLTESAGYAMRSYLWNGLEGSRELEVGSGSFAWGQSTLGGPVRYTMELTEGGEWHEVGSLTRPDGASMQIIEFELSRRPEG